MTNKDYKIMRKHMGLTQKNLAQFLGVPQPTISYRESGKRRISTEAEYAILFLFTFHSKY